MIWVVIGQTGSGKTTFIKEASKRTGLPIIKTVTTRPKRHDNEDDYVFVDFGKMKSSINKNEMIGVRKYATLINGFPGSYTYAVHKGSLVDDCLIITDWFGYLDIENYVGESNVCAVYMYTEPDDLLKQAKSRPDFNLDEYNRRVKADETLTIEFIERMMPHSRILSLGGTVEDRLRAFTDYYNEMK